MLKGTVPRRFSLELISLGRSRRSFLAAVRPSVGRQHERPRSTNTEDPKPQQACPSCAQRHVRPEPVRTFAEVSRLPTVGPTAVRLLHAAHATAVKYSSGFEPADVVAGPCRRAGRPKQWLRRKRGPPRHSRKPLWLQKNTRRIVASVLREAMARPTGPTGRRGPTNDRPAASALDAETDNPTR